MFSIPGCLGTEFRQRGEERRARRIASWRWPSLCLLGLVGSVRSGCVERALCSGANTGSAPRARSYTVPTGEAYGSRWCVYIYICISIYVVWGYMFYMPVLSVIGQIFTLSLCEASGKRGLGLEIR